MLLGHSKTSANLGHPAGSKGRLLLGLVEKRRALTQRGKHRLGELLKPVLLRLSLTKQGLLL